RLVAVVDAAKALQAAIVEALDAEAQAVDAGSAVELEAAVLGSAGIGLQGDLAAGRETQAAAGALQEALDVFRRKQAGRAATEEHRLHGAAPHKRQVMVEVGQQRIDVGGERQRATSLVRIEVAVRAFAHAPRQVHVERERRWVELHACGSLVRALLDAQRRCRRAGDRSGKMSVHGVVYAPMRRSARVSASPRASMCA